MSYTDQEHEPLDYMCICMHIFISDKKKLENQYFHFRSEGSQVTFSPIYNLSVLTFL